MKPVRCVCVFGMGGVGGYFGTKIARHISTSGQKTDEIFFIARGGHLAAIQKNGITLVSEARTLKARPTLATSDFSKIPAPDLILLCVKSYDLDNALAAIEPSVTENTVILPLLNGVDIVERIRDKIANGAVMPACVYVGTHIHAPGEIHQSGGDGRILFGQDPDRKDVSPAAVTDFFSEAGIACQVSETPYTPIWEKFMFIAAYGLVTAHSGKTVGQVLADTTAKAQLYGIMTEISAVSEKLGIALPKDIIETSIAKGGQFPFDTKTSYQRDVEQKGRKNEGDIFGGAVIRYGEKLGVATPVTRRLYSAINEKEQ